MIAVAGCYWYDCRRISVLQLDRYPHNNTAYAYAVMCGVDIVAVCTEEREARRIVDALNACER